MGFFRGLRFVIFSNNLFKPRGYIDGGVYIVSNEGMKLFNTIMRNDSICPDFHRAEEDQEVSFTSNLRF